MAKPKKSNKDGGKLERDEKGRVISGVLNPNGKPLGTLDFKTKWFKFIEKVAAQNNITPNEVDEQLLAVAFKQAKDANYPFYRDIQDRVHGKPIPPFGAENRTNVLVINVAPEKKNMVDKAIDSYLTHAHSQTDPE